MEAVFQYNASSPFGQLFLVGMLRHQDPVFFLVLVAWMGQLVGQVAVIGHEDQPFRVIIQPPYRVEVPLHRHQVAHRRPVPRIGDSRKDSPGLMEGHIDKLFRPLDRFPIDTDLIPGSIGLIPQADRLSVYLHPPGGDQFFIAPAGPIAGPRQDFLYSFFHVTLSRPHRDRQLLRAVQV